MNIGPLYRVKEWYWWLFPSKESADAAADYHATAASLAATHGYAAYYSKEYKENVTQFSPESYLVFLEEDGRFKKVLTTDGAIGWTWIVEAYNDCFEEVKSE